MPNWAECEIAATLVENIPRKPIETRSQPKRVARSVAAARAAVAMSSRSATAITTFSASMAWS
ncbi:hypothetical protein R2601_02713 [Salipiger bermudensis HTCC2601]|uniref:Uncharacterized protein n=1 Tax=Salipiger bermudensis (strain DSM 26914 / JCM 13377 / KCTC 12554 / HTCC2601) TaxID=314265 RepID=Q0FWV3_SALBH|nr:hypothetical protein R2601_02713 [Salipiger bermudensis HTCC2601]